MWWIIKAKAASGLCVEGGNAGDTLAGALLFCLWQESMDPVMAEEMSMISRISPMVLDTRCLRKQIASCLLSLRKFEVEYYN